MDDEEDNDVDDLEFIECVKCDRTVEFTLDDPPTGWRPVNFSRGEGLCPLHGNADDDR